MSSKFQHMRFYWQSFLWRANCKIWGSNDSLAHGEQIARSDVLMALLLMVSKLQDLRFPQQHCWRLKPSAMWQWCWESGCQHSERPVPSYTEQLISAAMERAVAEVWEIHLGHAARLQEEDFVWEQSKDRTVLLSAHSHQWPWSAGRCAHTMTHLTVCTVNVHALFGTCQMAQV